MSTLREQIADTLRAAHPEWEVCHYPTEPAQVTRGRPFVDVYATDLVREGEHQLKHTLRVDVYASRTIGAEAEAEAEDVRDEVLLALQRVSGLDWTTATRSIFGDSFIGYQITVVFISVDVYENHVRKEQAHA